MSDLISRKTLYEKTAKWEAQALEQVKRYDPSLFKEEWLWWSNVLKERTSFKQAVADAPSAEPEIIHCKDCKYSDVTYRDQSMKWLPCMDIRIGKNWFCGFGERKEE